MHTSEDYSSHRLLVSLILHESFQKFNILDSTLVGLGQRSLGSSRVHSQRAYGLHMLRQAVVSAAVVNETQYANSAAYKAELPTPKM